MNWFQSMWRIFLKSQTAKKPVKTPKPLSRSKPLSATRPKSKRVALAWVVGHNSRQRGATGLNGLSQEYHYNLALSEMIEEAALGTIVQVKTFLRVDSVGGYTDEIEDVYDRVDDWHDNLGLPVRLSGEGHYNSHGTKGAHGCETLHSTTVKSRRWAGIMQKHMLATLGNRDRGLKERMRNHGRGWLSMYAGQAPACLIEPGFGSNERDAALLRDKQKEIAQAVVNAAVEYAS